MCTSGCGGYLYTGSGDKSVRRWKLDESFMFLDESPTLPEEISYLTVSPDQIAYDEKVADNCGSFAGICGDTVVVCNLVTMQLKAR